MQSTRNVRVPDLAVTCSDYDAEESVLSDPVLIVEFLSPSSQAETWANAWTYTTIPSVREILVVWTVAVGVELLRRGADRSWPREPVRVTAGAFHLESIGLGVDVVDLYRSTRLRVGPVAAS